MLQKFDEKHAKKFGDTVFGKNQKFLKTNAFLVTVCHLNQKATFCHQLMEPNALQQRKSDEMLP